MSVDHTRVAFYSGFNAFKNVNVYETSIEVTGVTIPGESLQHFSTTIETEGESTFTTLSIEANEPIDLTPPRTPAPLRWQPFPSSGLVNVALDTDPNGDGSLDLVFSVVVQPNQVTFRLTLSNPYIDPVSFVPTSVGVEYAVHTIE